MCFCLDGSPPEGDADPKDSRGKSMRDRNKRQKEMETGMCGACCKAPLACICTAIPFTAPCMTFFLRKEVLGENMEDYQCCQGTYKCCCCHGGMCCEKNCPSCCLMIESTLCCPCAVVSTRTYMMDKYQLKPDPCDNRLIACQACVQSCGCLLTIVGCVVSCLPLPGADQAGKAATATGAVVSCIADGCFYVMLTCMAAQTKHQMTVMGSDQPAPAIQVMARP